MVLILRTSHLRYVGFTLVLLLFAVIQHAVAQQLNTFNNNIYLALSGGSTGNYTCDGPEVVCSGDKIIEIHLPNQGLTGSIPSFMDLPNLEILNLTSNELSGTLPYDLFGLTMLQTLDLSENNLSGNFYLKPPMSALQTLVLRANAFNVFYLEPPASGNFLLQHLDLSYNQFKIMALENIARHAAQLRSLTFLNMENNIMEGTIPPAIGDLPALQTLNLASNKLIGPFSLGDFTLETLDLHSNQLHNILLEVPPSPPLPLSYVDLSSNQFRVSVLELMATNDCFKNVTHLDMHSNVMSGDIPATAWTSTALSYLDLSWNQLTGNLTAIPTMSLTHIYVHHNRLCGELRHITEAPNVRDCKFAAKDDLNCFDCPAMGGPVSPSQPRKRSESTTCSFPSFCSPDTCDCFSAVYSEVDFFNTKIYPSLSGNGVIGQFNCSSPELTCLPAVGSITNINLPLSSLSGILPARISVLSFLEEIYLSENELHGTIPDSISDLANLRILNLNNNAFSGVLPASLTRLAQLKILDLSFNFLEGEIPKPLFAMEGLTNLTLQSNYFCSRLPPHQGNVNGECVLELTPPDSDPNCFRCSTSFCGADCSCPSCVRAPTFAPTSAPTLQPTYSPSMSPTSQPTMSPTLMPSDAPTMSPTWEPSDAPTSSPTTSPTTLPTTLPSEAPFSAPTSMQIEPPTLMPMVPPSAESLSPTSEPTSEPTATPGSSSPAPWLQPVTVPTLELTALPSNEPTLAASTEDATSSTATQSSFESTQTTSTTHGASSSTTASMMVSGHTDDTGTNAVLGTTDASSSFPIIPLVVLVCCLLLALCLVVAATLRRRRRAEERAAMVSPRGRSTHSRQAVSGALRSPRAAHSPLSPRSKAAAAGSTSAAQSPRSKCKSRRVSSNYAKITPMRAPSSASPLTGANIYDNVSAIRSTTAAGGATVGSENSELLRSNANRGGGGNYGVSLGTIGEEGDIEMATYDRVPPQPQQQQPKPGLGVGDNYAQLPVLAGTGSVGGANYLSVAPHDEHVKAGDEYGQLALRNQSNMSLAGIATPGAAATKAIYTAVPTKVDGASTGSTQAAASNYLELAPDDEAAPNSEYSSVPQRQDTNAAAANYLEVAPDESADNSTYSSVPVAPKSGTDSAAAASNYLEIAPDEGE